MTFSGRNIALACVLGASVVVPTLANAQTKIYVSTTGSDKYTGLLRKRDTKLKDGPKQTLDGARKTIVKMKNDNKFPAEGVEIILLDGTYSLNSTVSFTGGDGGTASAPVVVKAEHPGKAIITGGRVIPTWRKLPASLAALLKPEVRDKVYMANIRSLRPANFRIAKRGASFDTSAVMPQLTFDSKPMQLSQYPNSDWLRVSSTSGDNKTFTCSDPNVKPYSGNTESQAYGFFGNDWADMTDAATISSGSTVQLASTSPYGIKHNQRFRLMNVLEQIDVPGEYAISAKTGAVYFYPPTTPISRKATISLVDGPLVLVAGTRNLKFQGITFQDGRGDGMLVQASQDILVQGCTFTNIAMNAVNMTNVTNSGVDSCDISKVGEGGVRMNGGDRLSLTNGNNFVTNNWIHHYARDCKTYRPGVFLLGCGNYAGNNRIEDAPHSAIGISGNNQLVEKNEINRVCLDTSDAGAIYSGRNITFRGNVIRYNILSDVRSTAVLSNGSTATDVVGVYLDDMASGFEVTSNIFKNCAIGVLVGGGRENKIANNAFINSSIDVQADARGISSPTDVWSAWNLDGFLAEVNYTQAPYSTAYPRLATIKTEEPTMPKYNVLQNNVSTNVASPFYMRDNTFTLRSSDNSLCYQFSSNYQGLNPGFVNIAANDVRLLPGAPAESSGFTGWNSDGVGLQVSGFRTSVSTPAASWARL